MAISDWYPLHDGAARRRSDGKWRVEYDDLVARLRVCSDQRAFSARVCAGLDHDTYRRIAERIVADMTRH